MNCWQILQLEPTTDIRAIKKAYAVLLKQNKPDENPAGFQQLHAAYRQALDWADEHADAVPVRSAAPDPVTITATITNASTESVSPATPTPGTTDHRTAENRPAEIHPAEPIPPAELLPPVLAQMIPATPESSAPLIQPEYPDDSSPFDPDFEPLSPEEEAWENFLDQQWDTLVDQVELLLDQPQQRNQPAEWEFLTHSEALMDIEFKAEFSLRFLQRLVQLHQQQMQDGIAILLPDTVQHLNRTFWWDERRHQLEDYFEPDELDAFMAWWQPHPAATTGGDVPEVHAEPPPPYANYYMRWLALILDAVLLAVIGLGVNLVGRFEEDHLVFAILFVVFGYALLSPLFEASKLQGSPGKYWCGMKVCDRNGNRVALWRAVLRSVLFVISLRFIFIAVVINMLMWDGRLLQDRLTGSMVLKRKP